MISFTLLLTSFSVVNDNASESRDNTPGTVSFTVKTVSAGGTYAPKHVLAIWVERDGEFVKTRKAMANQRKQYLYTWKAVSNYNVVDAITGSTLTSHQTHTVEWDCTDLNGNVVADRTYKIRIEFTDKHAQGPLFEIEFNKGTEAITLTPPDEQYFKNIEFSYEPEILLVADFGADITEACLQQEIVFTDNSTGATSWEWDFGEDAFPSTANMQGPHTIIYSIPGTKSVSLTINGSISITKPDFITIHNLPFAMFTYEITSRTVTFTNTSQNAASYTWDFGDGNFSTEANPVHTYPEDGQYDVSLDAVSEMCGQDNYTETIVINTVGLPEMAGETMLTLFPNPSNGIFFITPHQNIENAKIQIFDINGKTVHQETHNNIDADSQLSFGNSALGSGVFYLRIDCNQGQYIHKLLVK